MQDDWFVYILRCSDGTLYTGITTDVFRRIDQHEQGTGAKYTRGRGPFKIHYSEGCKSRSDASRREYEIKALSREEKEGLAFAAAGDMNEGS